ncbi:MAG: type II CAAX endopeptidase family protein [Proteobacteria bacterium]|nr:type II CAAX endopeptidase family protein [Pseudomonadota bacterium]
MTDIPGRAVLWSCLSAVGLFALGGGIFYGIGEWRAEPLSPLVSLLCGFAIEVVALVLPLYLFVVRRHWRGWAALGFVPTRFGAVALALLAWIVAMPLIGFAEEAFSAWLDLGDRNPQFDSIGDLLGSPIMLGVAILAIGVIVPIAEEAFFRGLLFGWLRGRLGLAAGVLLSSLLFSVVHVFDVVLLPVFLLGILFAVIYTLSKSLWPAIIAHGTHNTLQLAWLYAAVNYDFPLPGFNA